VTLTSYVQSLALLALADVVGNLALDSGVVQIASGVVNNHLRRVIPDDLFLVDEPPERRQNPACPELEEEALNRTSPQRAVIIRERFANVISQTTNRRRTLKNCCWIIRHFSQLAYRACIFFFHRSNFIALLSAISPVGSIRLFNSRVMQPYDYSCWHNERAPSFVDAAV